MEFKHGFHHGRIGTFTVNHPVYIHPSVYIDNTEDVYIEEGCSISRNVEIYTHDHYHDEVTIEEDVKTNRIKASSIHIGKDVYVGAKTIILEGCSLIGNGVVIGAGSVVTKNIPPYEVWAGNPAKKIKDRKRRKQK